MVLVKAIVEMGEEHISAAWMDEKRSKGKARGKLTSEIVKVEWNEKIIVWVAEADNTEGAKISGSIGH